MTLESNYVMGIAMFGDWLKDLERDLLYKVQACSRG